MKDNPSKIADHLIEVHGFDGAWQTARNSITTVRRHINWNNQGADLKEDLAHLVQDIKRRICGIASAGSPSLSV
jgi:hypothetical protein